MAVLTIGRPACLARLSWRDVQAAIRAADLGVPVTFVRGTKLAFANKP